MRTFLIFLSIAIIAIALSGCKKTVGGGEIMSEEITKDPVELVVKGEKVTEEKFQTKKESLKAKFQEAQIADTEEKALSQDEMDALIDIINIEIKKGKTFQNVSSFEDIVNQI